MNIMQPASRILMILENNPYPSDIRVRHEAETLIQAGYHVSVVCPISSNQPLHEVVNGVEVHRFPAPPQGRGIRGYVWEYGYGTTMMLLFTLYVMLRRRFDVLHAYNPPDTVFLIGILAKLMRKKFVYDHRDPSPELFVSKFGGQGGLLYRILVWLERMCCQLADLVIAPNEFCRKIEISRHGVSPEKTVVVQNAPSLQKFTPRAPDPLIQQKAATIIGYVGAMGSQDGIDYLLRSLHYLKYTLGQSDFFALLIGPVEDLDSLQHLARSLEIEDHIQFTGNIPFSDKLLSYFSSAHICVEPAPASPLNNIATMTKLTEYLALSKPIVAYDLPGNRFLAGSAALYAQPNDEAEFARHIALLMDSEDMRRRLGACGRQRAVEQFNWEVSGAELVAGYERLLAYDDIRIKTGS